MIDYDRLMQWFENVVTPVAPPRRYRVRVRAPEDEPPMWTAEGSLPVGEPYFYTSCGYTVEVTFDRQGGPHPRRGVGTVDATPDMDVRADCERGSVPGQDREGG